MLQVFIFNFHQFLSRCMRPMCEQSSVLTTKSHNSPSTQYNRHRICGVDASASLLLVHLFFLFLYVGKRLNWSMLLSSPFPCTKRNFLSPRRVIRITHWPIWANHKPRVLGGMNKPRLPQSRHVRMHTLYLLLYSCSVVASIIMQKCLLSFPLNQLSLVLPYIFLLSPYLYNSSYFWSIHHFLRSLHHLWPAAWSRVLYHPKQ